MTESIFTLQLRAIQPSGGYFKPSNRPARSRPNKTELRAWMRHGDAVLAMFGALRALSSTDGTLLGTPMPTRRHLPTWSYSAYEAQRKRAADEAAFRARKRAWRGAWSPRLKAYLGGWDRVVPRMFAALGVVSGALFPIPYDDATADPKNGDLSR